MSMRVHGAFWPGGKHPIRTSAARRGRNRMPALRNGARKGFMGRPDTGEDEVAGVRVAAAVVTAASTAARDDALA
jgi:hypothetical protein